MGAAPGVTVRPVAWGVSTMRKRGGCDARVRWWREGRKAVVCGQLPHHLTRDARKLTSFIMRLAPSVASRCVKGVGKRQ
jgi:hypothetical protein